MPPRIRPHERHNRGARPDHVEQTRRAVLDLHGQLHQDLCWLHLVTNRESTCECVSADRFYLVREVLAQHPFEKAAVVGCQVREGCARLRPECDRRDTIAPHQFPISVDPIRIARKEPVVQFVDRSWYVWICLQLRYQHCDGSFDIAAGFMRFSSDLPLLDSVEPQCGVQTSRLLAEKDGVGVDDARTDRRVLMSHAAKLGGEQAAVESFDVVAGQVTARQ